MKKHIRRLPYPRVALGSNRRRPGAAGLSRKPEPLHAAILGLSHNSARIFNSFQAHICLVDYSGVILAVNKAWRNFARANGASPRTVGPGADYFAACRSATGLDAGTAAAFASGIREVMQGKRGEYWLEYACHSRRKRRWFIGRVTPLAAGDGICALVAHENITVRKVAETHNRHLHAVLNSIRGVTQLVIRERDPQRLLAEACRLLAQTRGYRLVWIARAEPGSGRLMVAAHAGGHKGRIEKLARGRDAGAARRGPIGAAIRTRRPVTCNDLRADPRFAPWREVVNSGGPGSCTSLPLIHGERIFGVLNIYADRPDNFDEEEMGLLGEVAADLAYALQSIEGEEGRRRAEEALSLSEQRFRRVFEEGPLGIAMVSPIDGKFLRANVTFSRMLGYTEAELRRLTFADVTHPDHRSEDAEAVGKLWEGRIPFYRTGKRYLKKSGEMLWGALAVSVIRDEDGQPLYSLAMVEDITKERRMRDKIRASEERYRALFRNSMDAVLLTSPDGSIHAANQAACRMLERTEEEIIQAGRTGLVDTADPGLPALLEERSRTGMARGELTMFRRDGSPFPVEASSAVFQDADGAVRTSMIIRDITVRREAEAVLRESEESLRKAEQMAHVGYWSRDLDTDEITWSDESFRIFGLEPQSIRLNFARLLEVIHPEDRGKVRQAVQDALADIRPYELEYRAQRPDGTTRVVHSRGEVTRDGAGRPRRMSGMVQDITERKLAEFRLSVSEERLRSLSARIEGLREEERSRIAREIHDELGQMLTGIKMDLRWIEDRLDRFGDDRRVNPILDKLMAASAVADDTIKSVQRIAAELRPGILDKLGLAVALQYEAARFEERTGITCRRILPEDDLRLRPPAATAFFRIFQEALTNVARHARASLVEVELQSEEQGCRLEIRDNGKGITGEDLVNQRSLGMLGMQERARLLGGEVTFSPRSGGGTVVTVRIPNSLKTGETR